MMNWSETGLSLPRDGEDEMDVRVDEFLHPGVVPIDFVQEIEDEREGAPAVILMEQHRMRNPAALRHLPEGRRQDCVAGRCCHRSIRPFAHKAGQFYKIRFFCGLRKDFQG